jgi:hypothetical protein
MALETFAFSVSSAAAASAVTVTLSARPPVESTTS